MKKVCVFLILGVSLAVSGQSKISKQTQAVNPQFTLIIAAYQSSFNEENIAEQIMKDGSTISLRIRKTNTSGHEIMKTSRAGSGYGYDYEVRDSSGKLVGPRRPNEERMIGGGRGGILSCEKCNVLKPGESKIDFVSLAEFDMSEPGTYTIQASTHISDDPASDVVKSNIITITVLPADDTQPAKP